MARRSWWKEKSYYKDPAFGAGTLKEGVCLACTTVGNYTQWCKHPRNIGLLIRVVSGEAAQERENARIEKIKKAF